MARCLATYASPKLMENGTSGKPWLWSILELYRFMGRSIFRRPETRSPTVRRFVTRRSPAQRALQELKYEERHQDQ